MLTIVAAVGENRAIGLDGRLPWDLPDDLRRFRELTWGEDLIMGRRTHESIGRVLDGRTNVVLSRTTTDGMPGAVFADDVESALAACRSDRVFVIGGEAVYSAFLPLADRLDLTLVEARPPADAWFPELDPSDWICRDEQVGEGDPLHTFHRLERRSSGAAARCLQNLAG